VPLDLSFNEVDIVRPLQATHSTLSAELIFEQRQRAFAVSARTCSLSFWKLQWLFKIEST